ncbi:MAG: GIY-YIG nuclease family protein [Patescibacteria group bacterium]
MISLKEKAKKIPKKPGVYFWLNKAGSILYVGRATNLHARVNQYFQKNIDSRIAEMVSLATNIKYEVCDNLLEAIILEAHYIKQYWPKYNVKDKDDRSFIYVVLLKKDDFPRPMIIRGQELKKFPPTKAYVFGPYQSFSLIQNALKIIRRLFPYGNCRPHSGKACFDYQIGLCPGACIDAISRKDYQSNIKNIVWLLQGEKKRLLKKLMTENPDKIKALQHIQDVSLLTRDDDLSLPNLNRIEGYDVSHLNGRETYGSMVVFSDGTADKKEYRLFKIKSAPPGDDERALSEMLLRRLAHHDWPLPDLIMIDGGKPQIDFVDRVLARHNIHLPLVGISKLGGDKLVFARGAKPNFKELAENIKETLLKTREEAHRFVIKAGRRARSLK